MKTLLRIHSLFTLVIAVLPVCFAQTDPKNVPQPPTAELKKFDPFLGKYQVSGDFANLPWTGTLELKKVIKGWYIEQIILAKTEGIDREFRIFATWDKNVQKYRLWGFQTLPIMPDNGGEIRFEGEEMITEWVWARPDGSKATSSNHYRFVSKDELEILSYRQVGNGQAEKIGFWKGKRMLNAEEAPSKPDHPPVTGPQPAPEMQHSAGPRRMDSRMSTFCRVPCSRVVERAIRKLTADDGWCTGSVPVCRRLAQKTLFLPVCKPLGHWLPVWPASEQDKFRSDFIWRCLKRCRVPREI